MSLHILNPRDAPTSLRSSCVIDLALTSDTTLFGKATPITNSSLVSDHNPLLVDLSIAPPSPAASQEIWSLARADWHAYSASLEASLRQLPLRDALTSSEAVEARWSSLRDSMVSAGRAHMPRRPILLTAPSERRFNYPSVRAAYSNLGAARRRLARRRASARKRDGSVLYDNAAVASAIDALTLARGAFRSATRVAKAELQAAIAGSYADVAGRINWTLWNNSATSKKLSTVSLSAIVDPFDPAAELPTSHQQSVDNAASYFRRQFDPPPAGGCP